MDTQAYREIAWNGIWKQNTSIAQILGLCPLLAVTTNAVNGIMLSLATIIVMALANVAVASLRNFIPHEIRIPVFILIVAALVTVVDLLFNANLHELYLVLGIFIPLIVTNCIVLARVEAYAAKNPPIQSIFDGIFMGVGMLWTLALLGGLRELIGSGTLGNGVARLAEAFGMRVLRAERKGEPGPRPGYVAFEDVLAAADKTLVRQVVGDADIRKLPKQSVDMAFNAVSEIAKGRNTRSTTGDAQRPNMGMTSIASLNKQNADFWSNRKG